MSQLAMVITSAPLMYRESQTSDATLISIAKAGDANAFAELSKRHVNKVYQAAYRVTRNAQDAEDALQDALLKSFVHLKNFEERASFSTWFTRIAINSALMILRRKRICPEIPIDGPEGEAENWHTWEPRCPREDPESGIVRREREQMLREAIRQLPPVYRDVVQLKQTTKYSTQQIAQSLGITVAAVKSRVSRAKLVLRASLLQTDWQELTLPPPSPLRHTGRRVAGKLKVASAGRQPLPGEEEGERSEHRNGHRGRRRRQEVSSAHI